MKKVFLFLICFSISGKSYCDEKHCGSTDYSCLINSARHEIYLGQREEGIRDLTPITGLSVVSRRVLAIAISSGDRGDDPQNMMKSKLLLESAFREGDMVAGNFLLNFYYGSDVDRKLFPENNNRAIYILKKIILQQKDSSGELECLLGELLQKNNKEDEAIYWLEKAANRGYLFAGRRLVPIFSNGKNKDLVKAWFYSDLGGTGMASEKHAIEKQMTPEQLEQAQDMSWQWQDEHHIHVPGYRGRGSSLRWQVESH
ncbi:hypothetical protein [Zymobacter palmae]|uniref:hypothetical protein n=1 Tax=Zymobacter palmae TaxID=33074 RepID=UPI0011AE2468|nr:hypothetical protein [Zymobacter palmae]